jgi:hypothetical protein
VGLIGVDAGIVVVAEGAAAHAWSQSAPLECLPQEAAEEANAQNGSEVGNGSAEA